MQSPPVPPPASPPGVQRHRRSYLIQLMTMVGVLILLVTLALTLPHLTRNLNEAVPRGTPGFDFRETSFANIEGWPEADFVASLETFDRSCAAIVTRDPEARANPVEALGQLSPVKTIAGLVRDWIPACDGAHTIIEDQRANGVPNGQTYHRFVREFFESRFVPVQIVNKYTGELGETLETHGLFTGYFEPVYQASHQKTAQFSAPLYARPDDLVELDLGQFRDELAGMRLAGRVIDGRLRPFESRAQINANGLDGAVPVLAWLDPDDAFFLQIQGSGVLQFPDQQSMRVGYAGQNGHPYTAIGKPLIERGALTLETVSLASIRRWLKNATPEQARALREENASYVFLRRLDNLPDPELGPLGAQGIQLTPLTSLAVDRRYHAMGTPIWLDMQSPFSGRVRPFRQLMIAQDTGGAIRGPVRGDVFWGQGEDAQDIAGSMRARGIMVALIPKPAAARWFADQEADQ